MKVVIVEDQAPLRSSLIQTISELYPDFKIVGEATGVLDGIKAILTHSPDIVFLDIEIVGGTSFDILDTLPEITFKTIFVTGFNHFAIKAIKYSAFDYLLKPIQKDDLKNTLDRLSKEIGVQDNYPEKLNLLFDQLKGVESTKIGISSFETIRYIEIKNIVRIEADRSYCTIVLDDNSKITSSKSLNHYEKILPQNHFFKVHRSHFININYIDTLVKSDGGYIVMSDESNVPISRRKKEEFFQILDEQLKR